MKDDLKSSQQKIDRLIRDNEKLKKQVETPIALRQFLSGWDTYLTPNLSNFVKAQVCFVNQSPHGRRYSNEFKQFALSLFYCGPKVYRMLQKTFVLPSPSSLHRFLSNIKCTAGINESVLDILNLKCQEMSENDKLSVMCIDEMSIKTHLFYNFGKDEVIGLEDNGLNKTLLPACSACVFMVQGINSNWKQPIAYTLSNTTLLQ